MTVRRRRFFRFSLRTLFAVVTVTGCWLGWQLSIVRERNEARALGERFNYHFSSRPAPAQSGGLFNRRVPLVRRLMGDYPVAMIDVPNLCMYHPGDKLTVLHERIRRAFPESIYLH